MDERLLAELESREIEETKARSRDVVERGFVASAADLYPEIKVKGSVAYARSLVPLSLLVLLYDRVAVFVPPLEAGRLHQRWGMDIEMLSQLARADVVHLLIGHRPDYTSDHFGPLHDIAPPSVWARGVALLQALGLEQALNASECPLPIEEMARLPELRSRFSGYLRQPDEDALTNRVKLELLTNYADLWIFGEGEFADSLAVDGGPREVAARLFGFSELRAYPTLFGFGGTANYDLSVLTRQPALVDGAEFASKTREVRTVPRNLDVLLRGIGVSVSDMSVEDILTFRASGDGQRLRRALEFFEREASRPRMEGSAPPGFFEAAERLEELVAAAAETLMSKEFRRKVATTPKRVDLTFRAGGVAAAEALGYLVGLPGLGFFTYVAAAAGGWKIVDLLIPPQLRDRVADVRIEQRFKPGLANLWEIKSRRDE